MYKRIRDGLFDPKKIVECINDRVFEIILFLLFFVILLTAPTVFRVINFDISYDTKSTIIKIFEESPDILFEIKDGKLVSKNNCTGYAYEIDSYAVVIGEAKPKNEYSLILKLDETSVNLKFGMFTYKLIDYKDYEESTNLELYNLTSGSNETWDKVFKVVNNYIDDRPGTFIVTPIIFDIIVNICSMLMVALIMSIGSLIRLKDIIKFSKIYKLNIYCLAPFAVGAFIDALFGISIVYIAGVIVTFIYSYITQIEVLKKVYSHHTEG